MKKKAFTMIELLLAITLFSFVFIIGFSQVYLMSETLYTTQTENSNRNSLSEIVFYLTREVQSAEKIKLSPQKLEICEAGNSGYNLCYEFVEDYPTDSLNFKGKKMISVKSDECEFSKDNDDLLVRIAVVKNSVDAKQTPKVMEIKISPRQSNVCWEVGE